MSKVADLLTRAADILATGGLLKHAPGPINNPNEPHCANGALWCALNEDSPSWDTVALEDCVEAIYAALPADWQTRSLPHSMELQVLLGDPQHVQLRRQLHVIRFNNDPSTTVEDVVLLFKQAAAAAESDPGVTWVVPATAESQP